MQSAASNQDTDTYWKGPISAHRIPIELAACQYLLGKLLAPSALLLLSQSVNCEHGCSFDDASASSMLPAGYEGIDWRDAGYSPDQ